MTIPGQSRAGSDAGTGPEGGASGAVSPALDVAVVIVTYRTAAFTIACLHSLQDERLNAGLHLRAVVVDNASGDLAEITRAVEEKQWSSWVTLVAAPKNGGFAYGNNLGIECACAARTPSYLFLLNPDTEVRPGALTALVKFLEAHPDAGIAGPSFETAEGADWKIAFRFPTLWGELEQGLKLGLVTRLLSRWTVVRHMGDRSEAVDWVSGSSMMIRPEVFTAIGGMDENYFLFFEETDLCQRARRAGFGTWYVPEGRVMHVGGATTNLRARRPPYWFESRRRYFAVTHGLAHAVLIDVVAVGAHLLGFLKRLILGRAHSGPPSFIRDLIHHSVIWNRNRNIPPIQPRALAGLGTAKTVQPRT